jgi:transcriptional regulator with XRE-family HTH domain
MDKIRHKARSAHSAKRVAKTSPVAGKRKTDEQNGKINRLNESSIVVAVGARLKRLRTQAGLTLEEFAAKSGVSRAMLSKVERGEKSPTLAVIARIGQGLNVSMSTLMGAEPDPAQVAVIRAAHRLTFRDPETGFERHTLSPAHVDSGIEFLLHRIPPGKSSGELPPYASPTEKYLVVQTGQLTVQIGKIRHVIETGDSFFFDVREPYSFINAGKTPCAYFLVIARRR